MQPSKVLGEPAVHISRGKEHVRSTAGALVYTFRSRQLQGGSEGSLPIHLTQSHILAIFLFGDYMLI